MEFWRGRQRLRLVPRHRAPPRDLGSITVTDLRGLCQSRSFVEGFRQSLVQLFDYKLEVYRKQHNLPLRAARESDWMQPDHSAHSTLIARISKHRQLVRSTRGTSAVAAALESIVSDPINGLAILQDRNEITDRLAGLLVAFSRDYRVATSTFLNFALMSGPGSGKTRLGQVIAWTFRKSMIMTTGDLALATRADLVGTHVGETAVKTRQRLMDSLEGVLFIDEAYALGRCEAKQDDFGAEAVTELVNFLDKAAGLIVVIVAGYQDKLQKCFFGSNEGLDRRFPFKFVLAPLDATHLVAILCERLQGKGLACTSELSRWLVEVVRFLLKKKLLPNGPGDMQNIGDIVVRTAHSATSLRWGESLKATEIIVLASIDEFLASRMVALRLT